ncbi:MAG: DUF3089 domain-containing protein [Asticcacaulis sp.]
MSRQQCAIIAMIVTVIILTVAFAYLQNDLHRNYLDPKTPFQIYRPPPAPDYTGSEGWYLNPQLAGFYADPRKVDVFFIHGTTFNGGKEWLGSTSSNAIEHEVQDVQLPNYAGPFAVTGNIYAPRYRQASLYTQLTLRDDAIEARQFAYRDIEAAFRQFIRSRQGGRGFVIAGVEQGGLMAERLLRDVVAPDPALQKQLVAAYLMETLVPQQPFSAPASITGCANHTQTGCVVAYFTVDNALLLLQKAVYWDEGGNLQPLSGQHALCVNPMLGAATEDQADARKSQGATNATGLEWGTEPAMIARKVSSHCLGGLLFVDKPKSPSFRGATSWEDRHKVAGYNLFYGDLEADISTRWQAWRLANGR